ncbi:Crp/Fnr family transcriptional regulator [Haliangium sp.]|uniref:Crp/Fnr family transcriptional regulator n=1 Tax=Haliangium sp. TaxID=2663208 RepID=UPI003D0B9342
MSQPTQHYFIEEYSEGTILFEQGEDGKRVYVVQRGMVEIRRSVKGQEALLALLGPGDFCGEMAIINERPRSAKAMIREDAELLVLDSDFFLELFHKDAEIAGRVARIMSQRLDHANRWLEVLLFKDPSERLIHSLRLVIEEQSETNYAERRGAVYVPLTLRELADRAGVTREQAIDMVERLAGDGLITSASAVDIDGPGYVVAEADLLLDFLGVSSHGSNPHAANGTA